MRLTVTTKQVESVVEKCYVQIMESHYLGFLKEIEKGPGICG
jgi:hypothetical protein